MVSHSALLAGSTGGYQLLVPTVLEATGRGERSCDLFSRLLRDRIVFIGTQIDADVANLVMAQLLFLESEDPHKDVHLYINSPGGEADGLMAIYDTMQHVRPNVSTTCMGLAASAASVLLAGGAAGKRFILPNARVLIHQPHGGAQGQAIDVEIQTREMMRMRGAMNEILARHTGQALERIVADTDRDRILTAEEAVAYGLADAVFPPNGPKEAVQ